MEVPLRGQGRDDTGPFDRVDEEFAGRAGRLGIVEGDDVR